ncbi:MAG: hypothetical protein K0B00_13645 [Rhodobacteraceae bacterium]|nr:hypothetical protein [Paracoccaceae bacterium]
MNGKAPTPAAQGKAAREARLAAELRANLARRKAQARGRAATAADNDNDDNDNKGQDS